MWLLSLGVSEVKYFFEKATNNNEPRALLIQACNEITDDLCRQVIKITVGVRAQIRDNFVRHPVISSPVNSEHRRQVLQVSYVDNSDWEVGASKQFYRQWKGLCVHLLLSAGLYSNFIQGFSYRNTCPTNQERGHCILLQVDSPSRALLVTSSCWLLP
jgi:hypothetical protein